MSVFYVYIFLDLKNRWDMSDCKIRICMAIEANIFVIFSFYFFSFFEFF